MNISRKLEKLLPVCGFLAGVLENLCALTQNRLNSYSQKLVPLTRQNCWNN